jgi:hypothetical protein
MAQNPNQTQQTQKRYQICSICHEPTSYPEMPWRIYLVEATEHGVAASNVLLFSAYSQDEAERWASKNCRHIVTCL